MTSNSLINTLKSRFEINKEWYPEIEWNEIENILTVEHLQVLQTMEDSGGEVAFIRKTADGYEFYDTCKETPDRKNLCYDMEARIKRKKFPPVSSALEEASKMGVQLLTVEEYKFLQTLFPFDLKTSSWVLTPANIRKLKGALFGDNRYQTTFIYHNGADSYYSSRGFRAKYVIK